MRTNTLLRSLALALLSALFCLMMPTPSAAQIGVGVAVTIAPPELPVYDQPLCPGDGYIWTPGYWAWDPGFADYYWVPGTWILAPEPGFLWTPGYWGWGDGGFFFTAGYWGPVVGFYGGVNYGFGYFGTGFVGGRWEGGHFFYNTAVSHVNVTVIHNTYETRIVNNNVTRVSYNGGNGGLTARPTAAEEAAAHERHVGPVAAQTQHIEEARNNGQLRSKVNHGMPPIAATDKPGDFKGSGVVAAREAGAVHEEGGAQPTTRGAGNPVIHARDIPAGERPPAPNTGDAKLDKKYQQQQEKLAQQQEKERQQLQAKQDADHAKAEKQQANAAKQQQMEQRHQQQTQRLQQRQAQQTQRMVRQQAPRGGGAPSRLH